jgi:hypothetical protein
MSGGAGVYSRGVPLSQFWLKWWNETADFRRSWDVWSSASGVVDRFGVRRPGVGWRACYRSWWAGCEVSGLQGSVWYSGDLPVVPVPGAFVFGPIMASVTAESDPADLLVTTPDLNAGDGNAVLYVARMAMNRGVETVRGWRYCGAHAVDGSAVDYVGWLSDIGWSLVEGEQIWTEVYVVKLVYNPSFRYYSLISNPVFLKVTVT